MTSNNLENTARVADIEIIMNSCLFPFRFTITLSLDTIP